MPVARPGSALPGIAGGDTMQAIGLGVPAAPR
jgi:hypothetical protein